MDPSDVGASRSMATVAFVVVLSCLFVHRCVYIYMCIYFQESSPSFVLIVIAKQTAQIRNVLPNGQLKENKSVRPTQYWQIIGKNINWQIIFGLFEIHLYEYIIYLYGKRNRVAY